MKGNRDRDRDPSLSVHGKLTSVWEGNDADLLRNLLAIYPRKRPRIIVDTTWGGGRMWKGTDYSPLGLDLNPERAKGTAADYTALPLRDQSVDVLVFDPPHLVKTGTPGVIKGLYTEYHSDGDPLLPFMTEAKRVLISEGLVLAKICDFVTSGRYNWRLLDLILAVRRVGMCPCDLVIKSRRSGVIEHPAWKGKQNHARKRHSYWVVIRNSNRCS